MVVPVEVQPVEDECKGELNDGEEEVNHGEAQELPNELHHHCDPGGKRMGKTLSKKWGCLT
jgi:hypothetical protein